MRIEYTASTCPSCRGEGWDAWGVCERCDGTGRIVMPRQMPRQAPREPSRLDWIFAMIFCGLAIGWILWIIGQWLCRQIVR